MVVEPAAWAEVLSVQGGGAGFMGVAEAGRGGLVGSGVTAGSPLWGRYLPEEKM